MADNGKSRFERAVEARLAVLGVTASSLAEAAGWSRAQFSRIKSQRDPKLSQVRRMALLLGLEDASVLMRDPIEVASATLPPRQWLEAVTGLRDLVGFAEYAGEDEVWSLDQLIVRYTNLMGA